MYARWAVLSVLSSLGPIPSGRMTIPTPRPNIRPGGPSHPFTLQYSYSHIQGTPPTGVRVSSEGCLGWCCGATALARRLEVDTSTIPAACNGADSNPSAEPSLSQDKE
jgi:hypothetical protein